MAYYLIYCRVACGDLNSSGPKLALGIHIATGWWYIANDRGHHQLIRAWLSNYVLQKAMAVILYPCHNFCWHRLHSRSRSFRALRLSLFHDCDCIARPCKFPSIPWWIVIMPLLAEYSRRIFTRIYKTIGLGCLPTHIMRGWLDVML